MKNIIVKLAVGVLTVFGLNACAVLEAMTPTYTVEYESGWVAEKSGNVFTMKYTDSQNQSFEVWCNKPNNVPMMFKFTTPAFTGIIHREEDTDINNVKIAFKVSQHGMSEQNAHTYRLNKNEPYDVKKALHHDVHSLFHNPMLKNTVVVVKNLTTNETSGIFLPFDYHICDDAEFKRRAELKYPELTAFQVGPQTSFRHSQYHVPSILLK